MRCRVSGMGATRVLAVIVGVLLLALAPPAYCSGLCRVWEVRTGLKRVKRQVSMARPVTEFPRHHNMIVNNVCGGAAYAQPPHNYSIPPSGMMPRYREFRERKSTACDLKTGAELFYSYDSPSAFSSATGYEKLGYQSSYMVQDTSNQTYWVVTQGKPKASGNHGSLSFRLDSPCLGSTLANEQVSVVHVDDAATGMTSSVLSSSHLACENFKNRPKYGDCAGWNKDLGKGSFGWKWADCCTDGMVLGPMPPSDYCIDIEYLHIHRVARLQMGSWNSGTKELEFPVQVHKDDMGTGVQLCSISCETHCSRHRTCSECTTSNAAGYCQWCDGQCSPKTAEAPTCASEGPSTVPQQCTACSAHETCSSCTITPGCGWCYSTATCMSDAPEIMSSCPRELTFFQAHNPARDNTCHMCGGAVGQQGTSIIFETEPVDKFCYGHGDCNPGTHACACHYGWWGDLCEKQCPGGTGEGGDPPPCSSHGICQPDGACTCDDGWAGIDCSAPGCSATGSLCRHKSVAGGGSTCDTDCGLLLSGNGCGGALDAIDACVCREGFWGASCDQACPGVDPLTGEGISCGEEGTCNAATGACECPPCMEYAAASNTCQMAPCSPSCGPFGECTCDKDSGSMQCACIGGFGGADCTTCLCQNGGQCSSITGDCQCPQCSAAAGNTFFGKYCEDATCSRQFTCSGNGECVDLLDTCICDPHYYGSDCSTYCDAPTTCNGHGSCAGNNGTCVCVAGYAGVNCELCAVDYGGYPSCQNALRECRTTAKGVSYRGTRAVSMGGYICQRWDSQTPHAHQETPTNLPDGGLEENYCRNPDADVEGPWCYVLPIVANGSIPAFTRQTCDIPRCAENEDVKEGCVLYEVRTNVNQLQQTVKIVKAATNLRPDHVIITNDICGGSKYAGATYDYRIPAMGPYFKENTLNNTHVYRDFNGGNTDNSCVNVTGGELFYAYEAIVNDLASHGYSLMAHQRLFFVQDTGGNAYFIVSNNAPKVGNVGNAGQISMFMSAADLATSVAANRVDFIVRDDENLDFSDPTSQNYMDCAYDAFGNVKTKNALQARNDCYVFNSDLGVGSVAWVWYKCCTDGMVFGKMPSLDYCFNVQYPFVNNNVQGVQVGDWSPSERTMYFSDIYSKSDVQDGGGITFCAITCEDHCKSYTTCGSCATGEGRAHCHWCDGACRSKDNYPQCQNEGPISAAEECPDCTQHIKCGECLGTKDCGWCYASSQCFATQSDVAVVCSAAIVTPSLWQAWSEEGPNSCPACGGAVDNGGQAVEAEQLLALGSTHVAAFCNDRGTCGIDTRECTCTYGYFGPSCEYQCPGGVLNPCSGHGTCTSAGVCVCNDGWNGPDCAIAGCPAEQGICMHFTADALSASPSYCTVACGKALHGSGGSCSGFPTNDDACECLDGWGGDLCDEPCPGINVADGVGTACNGNGICDVDESTCTCKPCYELDGSGACVAKADPLCVNGESRCDEASGGKVCECLGGYAGALCDTCGCLNGGVCDPISFKCNCPKNLTSEVSQFYYFGRYCESGSCSRAATCSGHGDCLRVINACVCDYNWYGTNCSSYCHPDTTCNGNGACTGDGECLCRQGYTGASCDTCAPGHFGYPFCSRPPPCVHGTGQNYAGSVTHTASGFECQRWDAQTPHAHSFAPSTFPELQENYCRNPNNDPAGPWCYTMPLSPGVVDFSGTDPRGRVNETCNIPACDVEVEPLCTIWTLRWMTDALEPREVVVKPVTHFPAGHSVIQSNLCGGSIYAREPFNHRIPAAGDLPHFGPIAGASQDAFQGCNSVSGGELFYSYDSPYKRSSDTGFEEARKQRMYFVQDDQDGTYLVVTNDRAHSGVVEGGGLTMKVSAPDLGSTNSSLQVNVLHADDARGAPLLTAGGCLWFAENSTDDCAAWDPVAGKGSFGWKWTEDSSDGLVLGRMPATGFCLHVEYSHVRSIDSFQVGDYMAASRGLQFKVDIPANELSGSIQMCSDSCETHCSQFKSCGQCSSGSGEGHCAWCDGECVVDTGELLACEKVGPVVEQDECTSCAFKPACNECIGTVGCSWCFSTGTCYDDIPDLQAACPSAAEGMWQKHEECPAINACGKCGGAVDVYGNSVSTNTQPVAFFCSGRGICDPDTGACDCSDGWWGEHCQSQCPGGASGEYPGNGTYPGAVCSGHGRCLATGACICDDSWEGFDCSLPSTCTSVTSGMCRHKSAGGGGAACDTDCGALLEGGDCGGALDLNDACVCRQGFFGAQCDSACPGINATTGEGVACGGEDATCGTSGSCVCPPCFSYNSTANECQPDECAGGCDAVAGECECDQDLGSMVCQCFGGLTGADCTGCACLNGGTCTGPGRACECAKDASSNYLWFGPLCDQAACTREGSCSGNGHCATGGGCVCDKSYVGSDCSLYCDAATTCNGHGVCCESGCHCFEGFQGVNCTECAPGFSGYPSCVLPPDSCVDELGIDYRGVVNRSLSGFICQRWDQQSPHAHNKTVANYPGEGLDDNFCRNPDRDPAGPWCYTLPLALGKSPGDPLFPVREKCAVEKCRYCHPDAAPLLLLKEALSEDAGAIEALSTWQGCNPCAPPYEQPFPTCGPNGEWCQKCKWKGIWCGRRNRVVTVDLRGLGLRGELPDSLTRLTFVRMLKLQNNNLYGTIPEKYSKLDHLQAFNTRNNNFTGGLPSKWRSVQTLRRLNFRNNALGGALPVEFSQLSDLFRLRVTENAITGELPQQWSAMTALKALSMGDTELHGNLPKVWSTLTRLEILNLRVDPNAINPNVISNLRPQAWKTAGVDPLMWVGLMNESVGYQNDTYVFPPPASPPEPEAEPEP